jgi:putative Mg2+ transporter-C (MgtC) family protein
MGITTIDQKIVEFFNSGFGGHANIEWLGSLVLIVLSLIFALLITGVIGFEREYHGHAAGLRTHILVGLGSALVMIISLYGFSPAYTSRDPARLAAQVVSGIGFLGAGTIIQTGVDVKGLTTATTLWLVMALGLAAGSGNFVIATITAVVAIFSLIGMRPIEKMAAKHNPTIAILFDSESPILRDILQVAARFGINIRDIDTQVVRLADKKDALRVSFQCTYASSASVSAFVEEIRQTIKPIDLKIKNKS